MTLSNRLAELGIELPPVVAPVGAYIPAKVLGSVVQCSGALPMVNGALPVTGKVGVGEGFVDPAEAKVLARQCAINAIAAAADAAGSVDRLVGVARVMGFVASDPSFTGQPGVVNGASELLGELFGEQGLHPRSAVGVPVLPLDSPVEVEIAFLKGR